MRRFYKDAKAARNDDGNDNGSWGVQLDGRPVRTPGGTLLGLPTQRLAEAVAEEWASQGEHVKPLEMPLMTLSCTAMDIVAKDRDACVGRVLPYLVTDTVCFEDYDDRLVSRQREVWAPLRKWFARRYGVTLNVGRDFKLPGHPPETLAKVKQGLLGLNEWEICSLEVATRTTKSLIVAKALMYLPGTTPAEAAEWALLEESFQIELWGELDDHEIGHDETTRWLGTAQQFYRLCQPATK